MTVVARTLARLFPHNRALGRLLLSALTGVLAGVLVSGQHGWAFRLVTAWDATLLTLLALAWSFILRFSPEATRARAAAADPGRTAVWAVVVVATTASIFAANAVVRNAKTLSPNASDALLVLALLAVVASWFAVHTAYTLRYAAVYYGECQAGGLRFPDNAQPADIDFAYYAFTVGMCFGSTDVLLTDTRFRRLTLGHALLSFFFNTGILALTLNLIFTTLG
jgi:uncharacterized membrane protein